MGDRWDRLADEMSNQCRNDLLARRMDEYGLDLVMASSHYGVRPDHAKWQGRVYSRGELRPKTWIG